MKKTAVLMTGAPRGGRCFVFALAVSLLVHAGAAAFIGVLPISGGREEAPVVEDRVANLLRPVQITFVPMSPRNSITTPTPPATDLPPKPDREMAKAEPPPQPEPAPPPEPKPPTPPVTPAATPAVKPRAVERDAQPPAPSPPSPAPKQERPPTAPAAPAIASTTRSPSLNASKTAGRDSTPGPAAPGPVEPAPAAPGPVPNATPTAERKPGTTRGPVFIDPPDLAAYYPRRARIEGVAGRTSIRLTLAADGRVTDVEVLDSTPPGVFETAARRVGAALQFQPAMRDGRPVAATVSLNLVWRLE